MYRSGCLRLDQFMGNGSNVRINALLRRLPLVRLAGGEHKLRCSLPAFWATDIIVWPIRSVKLIALNEARALIIRRKTETEQITSRVLTNATADG